MSTKLSNGVEYFNPHFAPEFAEFLLANNFTCYTEKNLIKFRNEDLLLVVTHDQVDHYVFYPGEPGQEYEKWIFEQSHIGGSHLNIFGWILLMHIMGVLKIAEFMRNASQAGLQDEAEALFLVKNISKGPLKQLV